MLEMPFSSKPVLPPISAQNTVSEPLVWPYILYVYFTIFLADQMGLNFYRSSPSSQGTRQYANKKISITGRAPTPYFSIEKFKQKPDSIGKILRSVRFQGKNCVYRVALA